MGYQLHISRRKDWPDDGPSITFDEWMAVVDADPEFRLEGYVDRRLADGSVFRQPLAAWVGHPGLGKRDYAPVLDLVHGNVSAKHPDREFRCKMWRLAQTLNARVQGDDGEYYDRFGNPSLRAWIAQSYWLALFRHFSFKLIWGDAVES
jgi:hypothetical protein